MAITTLTGVIAGSRPPADLFRNVSPRAAAVWHSFAYNTGIPAAAASPAPGVAGAALTSYAGQLPFTNPTTGNTHLARVVVSAAAPGLFRVYDRLWHNSGLSPTLTTAQAVNSAAWPARDTAGSTDGAGVGLALEFSSSTSNAANASATISYTNSAGVAGRIGTTGTNAILTSNIPGTWFPFMLDAGDVGVRSVQSFTLSASLTAAPGMHLVAYRSLVSLSVPASNTVAEVNAVTGGFPRLYDNTVPFAKWLPSSTNQQGVAAQMYYAQG